jgi:phosphoglycolate phosphatase
MTKLRLAVFDVDGTLVDSQHNIVSAMTEAWGSLNLGIPRPDRVRRIIGLSLVDACSVLLPWAPPSLHRAVADAYKEAFRAMRLLPDTMEPLFPGVREALDTLEAEGWLLGIATGKSRRGVDSLLESHDLKGRFVTIQTADDNPSKPNPSMLKRAAEDCGLESSDIVMIGDTAYDMAMAAAARTGAVGVSWGYHSLEELHQAGAQVVLDTFDNITEVLDALTGERG